MSIQWRRSCGSFVVVIEVGRFAKWLATLW
jgi:hypothetical protein